jgi:hypothetical protein
LPEILDSLWKLISKQFDLDFSFVPTIFVYRLHLSQHAAHAAHAAHATEIVIVFFVILFVGHVWITEAYLEIDLNEFVVAWLALW